jgi:hypothetical protein
MHSSIEVSNSMRRVHFLKERMGGISKRSAKMKMLAWLATIKNIISTKKKEN